MIAAAENHGSDTSNGDAIAADDTGVDIGSALLGAPFESFRVEPEIPKELGIFQRLKSLLVQPATGPAKSPEADIVVTDINPQSDQTDVEENKVAKEVALSDQDIQEEFDEVQDGQFDGEFISFSDEEDGIARHHLQELRSFGEDNADNKKSAATPSDRNEWRKNLSKRQIRDRFEEIINQLTVIKQKPVWFDSRKRLPGQIGGYRGDSLAKIFQEEILDFVHYLSPTAEEHRIRQYIVNRIQNVVSGIWPDATVNVFGSFNTQLYLPSSDIDLVVLTPSCKDLSSRSVLQTLAKKLRKSGLVYGKTLDIIPARVPIVKFTDCIGQYSIDISHGIENGIAAANRMTELIKEYPAIRPLAMILKQFLLMRGLNEVYSGGLGSYGLTLFITSFLQMHPRVQSGAIREEENLGVLLIQLLELYGKRFSYETVGISTKYHEYFRKGEYGRLNTLPHEASRAVVEDPDDETNNITRGTFNLRLVKASFSRAGDILIGTFYELNRLREGFRPRHRFTVKSILGTIVQIPDSVVAHREFVHRVYIDNKPQIDADHWPLGNLIGDALSGAAGNKRRLGGSSENGDDCGDDQPTKRRRLSTGSGSSSAKPGKKKKQKKKAKQMKTKRRRKFQTF